MTLIIVEFGIQLHHTNFNFSNTTMNKIELKIALRSFLKSRWYNLLNISGLALGFAAFIFLTLYVNHETAYDRWNKNLDRIYLVERELPTGASPYTPGLLAGQIKSQCPEVEDCTRKRALSPSTRLLFSITAGDATRITRPAPRLTATTPGLSSASNTVASLPRDRNRSAPGIVTPLTPPR